MSCCCAPSCAVPSCPQTCCSKPCCSQPCCSKPCCSPCSYPVGGLGTLESCCSNCCSCCGNSISARCLGITSEATNVGCVNQIPPSEVCIQPPPFICVIPGPVIAASCEPVRVGGYTACAGCSPCGRICS